MLTLATPPSLKSRIDHRTAVASALTALDHLRRSWHEPSLHAADHHADRQWKDQSANDGRNIVLIFWGADSDDLDQVLRLRHRADNSGEGGTLILMSLLGAKWSGRGR
jgi:hypothetical protein